MGTRLDLQTLLMNLLNSDQVYYQPPESIKMKYPSIVYELDDIYIRHANNHAYSKKRRYKITYITTKPDSPLIDILIDKLPSVEFDRRYISDNLYHFVYTIYY